MVYDLPVQLEIALVESMESLEMWNDLIKLLKTDYEHNSIDVLEAIEKTKSKSNRSLSRIKSVLNFHKRFDSKNNP